MPEPAQLLFARLDELAPDARSPLLGVDVDREQLAVGARISARADADEPNDLTTVVGNERRGPSPVPLECFFQGERLQLLGRERMGVGGLPCLDLDPRDSLGVVGCPGANHLGEPTLRATTRLIFGR